jgi:hypothetical protein
MPFHFGGAAIGKCHIAWKFWVVLSYCPDHDVIELHPDQITEKAIAPPPPLPPL